ncbi:class I SAM-dependent methyltransferase [Congregibacter sp.]|uniref:class I SAM-dependent methyltransferase n=1 Tax=Congregibacter sp. TaxID=2744308 RepID=UPI003F6B7039
MKVLLLVVAALVAISPAYAADIDDKIAAALSAESRPEAHRSRDRNRKPLETLKFFGLKDDMRVLELIPGGGWYTRVLAPVLAENGKLYVSLGAGRLKSGLLTEPGFDAVTVVDDDANMRRESGARYYTMDAIDLDVDDMDMVLTFRNVHNFDASGRAGMHAAAFAALKSGGVYGVVDHSKRHMEPETPENRRRVDPVQAIKEIQAAGFEFVDYSTLHYRADDELEYEVGRKSVTGNTDRFTFLFRKP